MALFDRLVRRVEECSGDGIACEQCPVAAECRRLWDRACEREMVDAREYSRYAARLAAFRSSKRRARRMAIPSRGIHGG